MAAIFLFHGGSYKRGVDDFRLRVPLTIPELDAVTYDPDAPSDTDNSIKTELDMGQFKEVFENIAVDDEIFIAVFPGAAIYRALWFGSFDAVDGLTVELDLVRGADVLAAFEAGDATGVDPVNPEPLVYDFANGVGDSTCDAVQKAEMPYGSDNYADYRNDDGLVILPFAAQIPAGLGDAMYLRMKITEIADNFGQEPGSCCSNCAEVAWPVFQAGAVYDRLCFSTQRAKVPCRGCSTICGC